MHRQVGLLAVTVVAVLILLLGGTLLLGSVVRPAGPAAGSASGSAVATAGSPSVGSRSPAASQPQPTGPDPVLVGAGDIAACGSPDTARTAALVAAIAGTVFTAGDNAYENGSEAAFAQCYDPTWGPFRDRTRPALGERDVIASSSAAPYFAYFGPTAGSAPGGWYSYDLGPWHVVVLDSNCPGTGGCAADGVQGRWLAADLAASHASCTVAIWHHPRFSSGQHGDDPRTAPFWTILAAHGAELVINAHDRDYERFPPQDPNGRRDDAGGIVEIVAGTGGAGLDAFGPGTPTSVTRASVSAGVVVLTLHRSGWDERFVSVDGSFTDRSTGSCH